MGLDDHWTLYKWISNARMPAVCIRSYETACGIDYATRWLAASANRLLIDIPTGGKRFRPTRVAIGDETNQQPKGAQQ